MQRKPRRAAKPAKGSRPQGRSLVGTLLQIAALALLAAAVPVGWWTVDGLRRGLDVEAGLRHVFEDHFSDPSRGSTIDPGKVPSRRGTVTWAGNLGNHLLAEASGLAVSSLYNDEDDLVLWAVNDSGNDPYLFALEADGRDIGFARVAADNFDWESLAAFRLDNVPYLLIADTGDNYRWRPQSRLLVVREPDAWTMPADLQLDIEWEIVFSWPDGYRDVEAVAADGDTGRIILITKRGVPAEIYALPLKPASNTPQTARRLGSMTNLPQPQAFDLLEDPDYGAFRSQPTGLDLGSAGALVVTYKDAYLFPRRRKEDWGSVFSQIPQRISLPPAHGRETVAFIDSDSFVTTQERVGNGAAAIWRVDLQAPPRRQQ